MGYEVEIKFRVADASALVGRLRSLGAEEGAEIEQVDRYLAHPGRDFAATDEALRLRRLGPENRITYKGPKVGGPTKTREEIEVPFGTGAENLAQMAALFDRLGFRLVAEVSKSRTAFALRHEGRAVEVTLDRAGPLGVFAEVEALAADADGLPGAQRAVLDLAAALGLSDVEPRSYLRMTLERGG